MLKLENYKVSYGDLVGHDLLQDSLVDPLVVAAEQDQVLLPGQVYGHGLVKGPAHRGHVYHPGFSFQTVLDAFPCIVDRLGLHQHAGSAPVGVIVHTVMFIQGIVPDIDRLHGQKAPVHGPGRVRHRLLADPSDGLSAFEYGGSQISRRIYHAKREKTCMI